MEEDIIQKIIDSNLGKKWWLESERKVVGKYGKLFDPANIHNLTKEDFKSFLLIKNNLHWEGIHRQGNLITADMEKLRKYLSLLLDENLPTRERLEKLFDKKSSYFIKGLGRAVITPILMVVYPDKYGVWNTRSEFSLKKLGLFPSFSSKESFADKYLKVNEIILDLSSKYQVSLWNLDGVFGELSGFGPFGEAASESEEEIVEEEAGEHGITDLSSFGMESHLEDFLISNWDKTVFGKDYDLIYEEGDLKSQQFQTPIGLIDILAVSKDGKEYLIIELKKGRTNDAVVGQILRYIHWVEDNLVKESGTAKGAVVVLDTDEKLKYSLKGLKNIALYSYKVSFQLTPET